MIGNAFCDLSGGAVEVNGLVHRLEPRLCGVLALLVQKAGTTVTRDEFLDLVWDGDGSDEALTQTISRLRQLLGDRDLIATIPRIGYQLSAVPDAITGDEVVRPETCEKTGPAVSPKLVTAAIALLAAMVAALGTWLLMRESSGADGGAETVLELEAGPDLEFHRMPEEPR